MTFLFEELEIPELFWWKELDSIIYNYRNTIPSLNNTLDRTQGRICWSNKVQSQLIRIRINTANRKTIARELYDDLRHNIAKRCNEVDKELITVRAKQWLADIEKERDSTPQQMTETVIVQLRRCFEPIDENNNSHHFPYFKDCLDDWEAADLDQYGYSMGYDRLTEKECEVLIEAYRDWAHNFQHTSVNNNPNSAVVLPENLDKDDAKKYFERAIENGYMELSGNKAKWKGTHAQVGFFSRKAYKPPRPISALEDFFGVKNLGASITQASYKSKRSDVEKWRNEMKSLIFFDL